MAAEIDIDEARRLYAICPTTGDLIHLVGGTRRRAGEVAGYQRPNGYITVWVSSKLCLAHRVIWTILHGPIPQGMQIDHVDGNCRNNRIENLRLATHQQNNLNRRVSCTSMSGFKGVQFHPQTGKWRARIQLRGKTQALGLHETPELASRAYADAARRLHGDFARIA